MTPFIPTEQLVIALFLGLLALAAVSDATRYRIPNRYSLAIALLYPAHVMAATQPVAWGGALMVAAAVFLVGFALFAGGFVGGGDVKMLTAVALWAGPAHVLPVLMITALAGGLLGLVLASPVRFGLALAVDRRGHTALRDNVLAGALPYGIAIAGGGLYLGWILLQGSGA